MLGYAPYPMELGAQQLGLVFTGWGLLVAAFSVWFAPRLQARFGTARVLYVNMFALGVVMAVIAAGVQTPTIVIVAVIVSGAFIGINNTLTTQAVMLVSPVSRPVASSAYGFVRFIGGGLAPFVAGKLADATDLSVPFYVGGLAFLLAIVVLATGRRLIDAAESAPAEAAPGTAGPVVVAVGATADAADVVEAAAGIARDLGAALSVVRVRETVVIEELAIDPESEEEAQAALDRLIDGLTAQGIATTGRILHSVGDHAAAGRSLAAYADAVGARTVAVGRSPRGAASQFAEGSFTSALTHSTTRTVVLVSPGATPRPLSADVLPSMRGA
jgi:MFS transporter, ACDE family, multidrug resistance protein